MVILTVSLALTGLVAKIRIKRARFKIFTIVFFIIPPSNHVPT